MATSLPTTLGIVNRTVTDSVVEMTPEEQHVENLFYIASRINDLYLWAIFALGFPGNCAAIVTIVRMRSIGTFPIFVALLAVMDTMALSVKLLFFQLLRRQVDVGSSGCNLLRSDAVISEGVGI
ncbi:hypothetical protein C0Q70_10417 [Pomacea canaliculata]|uniref:G-protein coupled receptors family 1 profile domain-containing protein n=1 Tax=Pomacea canaliculata TaxID=400727 RepID=A0A2T7PCJ3_POMCA|nr:hypothetical protein C0Q70_10417 [Pomacea canaliculata]